MNGWTKERQLKYPDVWSKIQENRRTRNKGKHLSPKTQFKKGCVSIFKGKKHTPEAIKKIKEKRAKQIITEQHRINMGNSHRGEKSHFWAGGVYKNPYPSKFNKVLKDKIRKRDNYICVLCGRTEREEFEEFNRSLSVNHINFNKEDCREKNLNTLCIRCNTKICRDRDYWTNYFSMGVGQ